MKVLDNPQWISDQFEQSQLGDHRPAKRLVKLGGFLARKGDGEPGWQTIWHGYQRLHALLDGLQIAGAI